MVASCKICRKTGGYGLFTFPTKQPALNNWKLAAKIPESQATNNFRVCYRHFEKNDMEATMKISLKDKDGEFETLVNGGIRVDVFCV